MFGFFSCNDDGPDHGGQQQDGDHLERQRIAVLPGSLPAACRYSSRWKRLQAALFALKRIGVDGVKCHSCSKRRHEGGENRLDLPGHACPLADMAGEQDRENDQHHDTPGIYRQLHGCQESVAQHEIDACCGQQHEQQEYGRPEDAPGVTVMIEKIRISALKMKNII